MRDAVDPGDVEALVLRGRHHLLDEHFLDRSAHAWLQFDVKIAPVLTLEHLEEHRLIADSCRALSNASSFGVPRFLPAVIGSK